MDIKQNFDRIEKKYLITEKQKKSILRAIKDRMNKDEYHRSEVMNIYFDTDNFDTIIQSIDQPYFKHKIRARSYGGYDRVFLEIKTKLRRGEDDLEYNDYEGIKNGIDYEFRDQEYNLGYKRRVMITKKDYDQLIKGKADLEALVSKSIENPTDLQIAREINYLLKHLDMKPKIMVSYIRKSYRGKDDLRLTFDENLRFRTEKLKFNRMRKDQKYFDSGRNIIMEIKAAGVLPLWLSYKLTEEKIFPQQFSKIGKVYGLLKEQNIL